VGTLEGFAKEMGADFVCLGDKGMEQISLRLFAAIKEYIYQKKEE